MVIPRDNHGREAEDEAEEEVAGERAAACEDGVSGWASVQ